jgi:phospholipase C
MTNTGRAGVNLLVYSGNATDLPRSYTLEAGKDLSDDLMLAPGGIYDFSVFGPNGYLRRFVGKADPTGNQGTAVQVADGYDVANGNLQLRLSNPGKARSVFKVDSAYNSPISGERSVRGGDVSVLMIDLRNSFGWYDLTVTVDSDKNALWRIAGHVETGRDSASDPLLGA